MSSRKNRQEALSKKPPAPQSASEQKAPSPQGRGMGLSVRSASYSGPILPQQLEAYERSEAGRLYVRAMIKQSEHRMELEKVVIKGDNSRANRGQWFALVIALYFGTVGGGLVYLGHDVAGATIATGAVVGLVTAFITGTAKRKAERIEKAKLTAGQKESSEQSDEADNTNPRLPGI